MEPQNIFANSRVNITAKGKSYLVAVIGSVEYHDEYVKDLVNNWDNQLTILSTIAKVSGFKNKLNCFLRNIPKIRHLLLPLEIKIRKKFIPVVTVGCICNEKGRVLISLPTRYGWLVIPNISWNNGNLIYKLHQNHIRNYNIN